MDHVVVELASSSAVRAGFDRLLTLVDNGVIRVLDLEFVTAAEGVARTVAAAEVDSALASFDGASSGLLDGNDLEAVAAQLSPGATAAVLVYEDLSVLDVIAAWKDDGAHVVSQDAVDVDTIDAALQGA